MTPPRRLAAIILIAASCGIYPVTAAVPREGERPGGPVDMPALLSRAMKAAQTQDCAGVFAALDPVLPQLAGRERNAAQMLRLPCLLSAGKVVDARSAYDEVSAADPAEPLVRSIGVVIALATDDFATAAGRLTSLADDAPVALGRMTGAAAQAIIQGLTERHDLAARDRLFISLARASWQPVDRPEMGEALACGAIEALLNGGRSEEAASLLPRITAPDLLIGMAEERHYAPLWPQIEQRLGAQSADAIDRYAAARLDAFASRPDDPLVRRDAARAFMWLGRPKEAGEVAATAQAVDSASDVQIASVELDAQILAAQARVDAAVARLAPFATLDLNRTPRAASGLIGLAELLDENGRAEQALASARATLTTGAATLSPWGAAWLKRTEVCALAASGRKAEADKLADRLKADAAHNQAAAIEALLCANRRDEAAQLAVSALESRDGAGDLSGQFQPEGTLALAARSRLRPLWAALLERADVAAAFARVARILPERFWPARQPRPIPRVTRPDDVPIA